MQSGEFKDPYGKMWLVLPPAVGLPIFFIAILVASLSVHFAILTHTTWFAAFWQGHPRTSELVVPVVHAITSALV